MTQAERDLLIKLANLMLVTVERGGFEGDARKILILLDRISQQ